MQNKVQQFIQDCAEQIAQELDLNQALLAARTLAELLWQNHLHVFELKEIELNLLQRVIAHVEPNTIPTIRREQTQRSFLHVMTKAYATGGHTRVVESLLKCDQMPSPAVMITEKIPASLLATYQSLGWECFAPVEHGSLLDAVKHHADIFERFDVVMLVIHPYDIVSVIAAGLARHRRGTRILFYNHADHNCNVGYGVADHVLEISYCGWEARALRGIENKSSFAGIPMKLPAALPPARPAKISAGQSGLIASAGTAYKFKPSKTLSFPQFMQTLLTGTSHRARIVGPNRWLNRWWWMSQFKLGKRLELRPRLAYDAYLQLMQEVDAYIDSFPMTGGTAFTEIVVQGIPSFGLLSGSHGYSPTDQLKSATLDELQNRVLQYLADPQNHAIDTTFLHEQIREVHDIRHVSRRIIDISQNKATQIAPPWPNTVAVDVHFYAKIWDGRFGFAPIVHHRPDFRIVLRFLRLWLRLKFS